MNEAQTILSGIAFLAIFALCQTARAAYWRGRYKGLCRIIPDEDHITQLQSENQFLRNLVEGWSDEAQAIITDYRAENINKPKP